MIKVKGLTLENFRSVIGEPIAFDFNNHNVVVGPNNCGKSNVLRALNLFFNGVVDHDEYVFERDFPQNSNLPNPKQTRITVLVEFDPTKDVKLERAIKQLEDGSGQERLGPNVLRIRLEYSRKSIPQWRFFSKAGLRNIRSDLMLPVVNALRSSVRFKYLPVGRDISETIQKELSDELVRTIFRGWSGEVRARREINKTINRLLEQMQPRLEDSGNEMSDAMSNVFSEIKKLELKLPFDNLETMLPYLLPSLKDTYETDLNRKGAGIQTSTLLFLLKYLADHHPQHYQLRITYIWAIEEPESYLHPSRQRSVAKVLEEFSSDVQTILTTHCGHFVPKNGESEVYVLEKETASPYSSVVIGKTPEDARLSLGVSLVDSMYFSALNIVVEGPSDEILLKSAWEKLYQEGRVDYDVENVRFFVGKSANGAAVLYECYKSNVSDEDILFRLILDNDGAGQKALRGLIKRNENNFTIQSNKDYFFVEENMEWLASGDVMSVISEEHPSKVNISLNQEDEITGFIIHEHHKKFIAKKIIEHSTIDDLSEHQKLIRKIINSIE